MADVIIVGDGPGGLSAALFLARAGKAVVVFGEDKTAMHWAHLRNYLGIRSIKGTAFQKRARAQVKEHGGKLRKARVATVETKPKGGFSVTLEDGSSETATHLILSEGKGPRLALQVGLKRNAAGGIDCDRQGLTDVNGVYVVGRTARPGRSQAIISAGDGAAAALDILTREKGEDVVDWDEVEPSS